MLSINVQNSFIEPTDCTLTGVNETFPHLEDFGRGEKQGPSALVVLGAVWFGARCRFSLARRAKRRPGPAGCLPDFILDLGVDSGEAVQVRHVRRCDRDGIPWHTGERRLTGKDGIGVEGVGRRRRDARLSQERPELRSLDDRVGRQGQVVKTANQSADA